MTEETIIPTDLDILCGKDKVCVNHPGSKRFKLIIDSYCDRYTNALTKYDKMGVTKELFDGLRMTSRFLKYNKKEKAWEEISALAARDKVGHALRFASNEKIKKGKRGHRRAGSDFSCSSVQSEFTATSQSSAASHSSSSNSNTNTWSTPQQQPLAEQIGQSMGGQDVVMGSLMQALITSMHINSLPQPSLPGLPASTDMTEMLQELQHPQMQPPPIPPQNDNMQYPMNAATPHMMQPQSMPQSIPSQNDSSLQYSVDVPDMNVPIGQEVCTPVVAVSSNDDIAVSSNDDIAVSSNDDIADGNLMSMLKEPIWDWEPEPNELT